MEIKKTTVNYDDVGKRLDCYVSEVMNFTRNAAQLLIESGAVSVSGFVRQKNYRVRFFDAIDIIVPEAKILAAEPQNIPISIIYEDDDLLVVDKPKGMVVHPAPGNPDKTLVNALLWHCRGRLSDINGVIRPGILHRIDKNTSGLLVIAKNNTAHCKLAEQISAHTFTRVYRAIVCGNMNGDGVVEAPIGRSKADRKKMCVTFQNSKNAVTRYRVFQSYGKFSEIFCTLETGRTHQIRVHMAHIGYPVLGDDVYGKSYKGIIGQCLHAERLGFFHPFVENGEKYMEFVSELPQYFLNIRDEILCEI